MDNGKKSMTLSVIVPVYKVERYLQKCVDSILAQSVDGMEIILVDDRSPDGCPALCDKIAGTDSRIKTIHHTENKGLSEARNTGIGAAQGRYITFVDSDDFIAAGTYAPNIEIMKTEDADCIEYPVFKKYGSPGQSVYRPATGKFEEESFGGWIGRKGFMHSYACNKIFKKSLWDGIRFPAGKYFEDLHTIPYVLEKCRKAVKSDIGMYHYCDGNSGAITKQFSLANQRDLFEAFLRLYAYLTDKLHYPDDRTYGLYMELVNRQTDFLRAGGALQIPERKPGFREMFLLRQPARQRAKALLLAALGTKKFYKLLTGHE